MPVGVTLWRFESSPRHMYYRRLFALGCVANFVRILINKSVNSGALSVCALPKAKILDTTKAQSDIFNKTLTLHLLLCKLQCSLESRSLPRLSHKESHGGTLAIHRRPPSHGRRDNLSHKQYCRLSFQYIYPQSEHHNQ